MDDIILKKIEEIRDEIRSRDVNEYEFEKFYTSIKLDEDKIEKEEIRLKLYNLMAYICLNLNYIEEQLSYLYKIKKLSQIWIFKKELQNAIILLIKIDAYWNGI